MPSDVFSVIGADGTPAVSDFLVLELAAARGVSSAAADQLADILAAQGCGGSRDLLRSKAVGILASPARALGLLQSAHVAQDRLPEDPERLIDAAFVDVTDPACDDQSVSECWHELPGHVCGAVAVPVEKLQPKVSLIVHLAADAAGQLGSVARLESSNSSIDSQPLAVAALGEVLAGCRVVVRPVIDLNEAPATDAYEIPERLRAAVTARFPYEAFPWSTRRARGLDLDHTIAWRPGQQLTRLGNLAPLSRRAHRAKTFGVWTVRLNEHPVTGPEVVWRSPLGYEYVVEPTGTWRVPPRQRLHPMVA